MTGEELKRRRRQLGLSQTGLAALLGIPQNTISRWEVGKIAIGEPRSLWLDVEMARIEREHKRPRGRPRKRRQPPQEGT